MKERLFRQQIKAKRRSSYYEGRQRETLQYVERRRIMYTCNSSSGQNWSNLNLFKSTFLSCGPVEHQQILSLIEAGKFYCFGKNVQNVPEQADFL